MGTFYFLSAEDKISSRLRLAAVGCQYEDSENRTVYAAWRVVSLFCHSIRQRKSYFNAPSKLARSTLQRAA
jgi:hypothetical protein